MRTIATSANGTFDSGILYHGARKEGWRAWDGILRVKNNEAGSCTVTVINEVTGEPAFTPLSVGANAGVSGPVFTIPGSYRVTVTSVTGTTRCRIVLDGDTAKDSQTDLLALYDFLDGDVSNLFFGSNVRGAVSRDSLVYVDAGEQRRTDEFGLLCEAQRSNKCTNTNLKPTDTSGTTSSGPVTTYEAVSVGQAPSGIADPQGNVTGVYRLVASDAGANVTFNGVTGNTNPHTGSLWIYVVSGGFLIRLTGGGTTAVTDPGWQRIEVNEPTPGATAQLEVESTQAGECYFFGNQLEEGPTTSNGRTSLIEINGAAATRLGDNPFTNLPAAFDKDNFVLAAEYVRYMPPLAGGTNRVVKIDSGSDAGGTGLQVFLIGSQDNLARYTDEGLLAINGQAVPEDTTTRDAWGFDSGTTARYAQNGTLQGEQAATTAASYDFVRFGSSAVSGQQLFGYVRRVAIYNRAATEDYLTTGTTAGSGFDDGFDDGFG